MLESSPAGRGWTDVALIDARKRITDLCSFLDKRKEKNVAPCRLWLLWSSSDCHQECCEKELGPSKGHVMKSLANPTYKPSCRSLLAGTRSAVLNTEARTVEADVLSRRCVMMRLVDFSYEQYQKALRQSAGAVVIILPRSISSVPQDVVRVKKMFPFSSDGR